MQPTFSLTFPSPYGLESEPSRVRESPLRKDLVGATSIVITTPRVPGSCLTFGQWRQYKQCLFHAISVFACFQQCYGVSIHANRNINTHALFHSTHFYCNDQLNGKGQNYIWSSIVFCTKVNIRHLSVPGFLVIRPCPFLNGIVPSLNQNVVRLP